MNRQTSTLSKITEGLKKAGIRGIIIAGVAVTLFNTTEMISAGETVRIQNNITGAHEWHQTEGVKLKVPFFSTVNTYNSVSTIAVTDDSDLIDTASATRMPLPVTFADNYGGRIEASWRVRLSTSDEMLEQMHQEVKSQKNLEGNTFLTFSKDMLGLTSDQFLAQDFMQGGKGAFKQRLQDQAENGMLVTKREKVEIVGQIADQSLDGERDQASKAKQFAYQVVIQTDEKGKPLRRPHSLAKYGIEVTQVDLGEFAPDKDLVEYVDTIKKRERERADLIADQKKERESAVTEQLKGESARIRAKNKALMQKDQEVINGQKKVELAEIQAQQETVERQKVADLAKIDKQRELNNAKANEGIQKAKAQAAKYEAQAIKEKGFAEAAVSKAKFAAKQENKEIYLAELSRDETMALTKALPNTELKTPETLIINNGAGGTDTSMSDALNLKLIQDITKR